MGTAFEGAWFTETESLELELVRRDGTRWQTLQDIHRLLDGVDLDDALLRAFNLLAERHKLQNCSLALFDPSTGTIQVTAAVGLSGRARLQGRYRLGEGIIGQVVASGQSIIIPNARSDSRYLNRTGALAGDEDERAFVCVPVFAGGRAIGALGALFRTEDEIELNTTADFLAPIASAIGQAIRFDRLRRQFDEEPTVPSDRVIELPQKTDLGSLVGTSGAILSVVEQALQVAATKTTVLVRGESGTGKSSSPSWSIAIPHAPQDLL
jgi:Nif-specific regulatory protein